MIIKGEYKKTPLKNIKEECRNILKNFKSSGSEIRKMEESFREMHMDEEPEWPLFQSIEEDIRYKLFWHKSSQTLKPEEWQMDMSRI